jgi:large conductance mechanosensitive channel
VAQVLWSDWLLLQLQEPVESAAKKVGRDSEEVIVMSSALKEFKEFAMKGNVLDLAIGVVIGGAFGKIVSSLVQDMIMPTAGLLLGGISFESLQVTMGETAIGYGAFIQSIVDFLIIAVSVFAFVKGIAALKRAEPPTPAPEPAPAAPTKEEILLTEIRDLLKDRTQQ